MPLSAPINRDFRGLVAGDTVATPSGSVLNGTAPVAVQAGTGRTAANFVSNTVASYFRETITADSDFGQMSVAFLGPSPNFTGNKEMFPLGGAGAILASPIITTGNAQWMRDAAASGDGSTIGWTPITMVAGVEYLLQYAVIKGSTTANGSIKARLTRRDTGAVVASGLLDGTANTGTVQMNGLLAGLRTAAGNGSLAVLWYRFSNQAFDYLGDIPTAGSGETPVGGATSLAFVGDSTTDRSGVGAAQVKAAILANGQGWTSPKVQVNGLTSRTINYDNGVHPTAYEQIDVFRNAGYDAGTWAFAVGGNGGASDLAQQQAWIMDLLNRVAAGSLTSYRVVLYGFSRYNAQHADSLRFWQAIQNVTPPTKVTLIRVDYNALIHNGRDETGLWQSTAVAEAHMTSVGYQLRDQLMVPYLTVPGAGGANVPPTGTASATAATVGRISLAGTAGDTDGTVASAKWACTGVPAGVSARAVENDTSLTLAQFYYTVAGTYSGTLTLTDNGGAVTVKDWSLTAPSLAAAASSGSTDRFAYNITTATFE